jgi:hypothetical protein
MGMAVQPLYGHRARGLAGYWAGRDERNFGPSFSRSDASSCHCQSDYVPYFRGATFFCVQSKLRGCAETRQFLEQPQLFLQSAWSLPKDGTWIT